MLKWQADELRTDCSSTKLASKFISGRTVAAHSEAWFPDAEARVMVQFRDAREEGLHCNYDQLSVKMKAALLEMCPGCSGEDFVAGHA